jgi:hypothetical protein
LAGGVGRRQPVVQVLKPSGQHAVLPQSSAEKRIMPHISAHSPGKSFRRQIQNQRHVSRVCPREAVIL